MLATLHVDMKYKSTDKNNVKTETHYASVIRESPFVKYVNCKLHKLHWKLIVLGKLVTYLSCHSYLEAGFATKLDTFYFSVDLKSAASLLGKHTVV